MTVIAGAFAQHTPELCAAGQCPHAISERVPCRCPDCDEITREMVAGYRAEAANKIAGAASETTPRFEQRTFERFMCSEQNLEAYEAAKAVVEAPDTGLALHGTFGVGKSHLGAAIVNACRAKNIGARFISVESLLARVRATIDDKKRQGPGEYALLDAYATVPVLVLDDYGKESLSDYSVRTMFSLINRRYENLKPLVITSNASIGGLQKRTLGRDADPQTYAATMDRLIEMTGKSVEILGKSRR